MVEIIALVLLPLAVFIVFYAMLVFLWRNSQIALKQAAYIDDRRCGPRRCFWHTPPGRCPSSPALRRATFKGTPQPDATAGRR